jgi:hypothetical protein
MFAVCVCIGLVLFDQIMLILAQEFNWEDVLTKISSLAVSICALLSYVPVDGILLAVDVGWTTMFSDISEKNKSGNSDLTRDKSN